MSLFSGGGRGLERIGIEAVVEGVTRYTRDVGRVASSTEQASRRVTKASTAQRAEATKLQKSFDLSLKTALKFGVGLVGVQVGIQAVRLAFNAAIGGAIRWESAMTGVAKTVNASEAELRALGERFTDLSTRIPISREELAGLGEIAGQLGVQTGNIESFVETVAKIGVATTLTAEEAATALARFSNVMGTNQQDVGRLGASIVDLGNNFATTEREILEMALRLAGAGRVIGLTEGDVLGLATSLTSVGIRAEAGGTAFSRIMVEMSKRAEQGGDALRSLADVAGVTSEEFAEMVKTTPAKAIQAFVVGLDRAAQRGENLFGVLEDLNFENVRTRDALLRSAAAADLQTEAMNLGNKAFKDATALNIEAARRFETTASKIKIAQNAISNMAAAIGELVLPALGAMAEGFTTTIGDIINTMTAFNLVLFRSDDAARIGSAGLMELSRRMDEQKTILSGLFASKLEDLALEQRIIEIREESATIMDELSAAQARGAAGFQQVQADMVKVAVFSAEAARELDNFGAGIEDTAKTIVDRLLGAVVRADLFMDSLRATAEESTIAFDAYIQAQRTATIAQRELATEAAKSLAPLRDYAGTLDDIADAAARAEAELLDAVDAIFALRLEGSRRGVAPPAGEAIEPGLAGAEALLLGGAPTTPLFPTRTIRGGRAPRGGGGPTPEEIAEKEAEEARREAERRAAEAIKLTKSLEKQVREAERFVFVNTVLRGLEDDLAAAREASGFELDHQRGILDDIRDDTADIERLEQRIKDIRTGLTEGPQAQAVKLAGDQLETLQQQINREILAARLKRRDELAGDISAERRKELLEQQNAELDIIQDSHANELALARANLAVQRDIFEEERERAVAEESRVAKELETAQTVHADRISKQQEIIAGLEAGFAKEIEQRQAAIDKVKDMLAEEDRRQRAVDQLNALQETQNALIEVTKGLLDDAAQKAVNAANQIRRAIGLARRLAQPRVHEALPPPPVFFGRHGGRVPGAANEAVPSVLHGQEVVVNKPQQAAVMAAVGSLSRMVASLIQPGRAAPALPRSPQMQFVPVPVRVREGPTVNVSAAYRTVQAPEGIDRTVASVLMSIR